LISDLLRLRGSRNSVRDGVETPTAAIRGSFLFCEQTVNHKPEERIEAVKAESECKVETIKHLDAKSLQNAGGNGEYKRSLCQGADLHGVVPRALDSASALHTPR
jgi:hypothetical protein